MVLGYGLRDSILRLVLDDWIWGIYGYGFEVFVALQDRGQA